MSDFHEVLFPTEISYGSSGGPKWKTAVWTADSGYEARVVDWTEVRAEYNIAKGIQSEAQATALTNFFMNRRGRAFAFRFKDFNDYFIEDAPIGIGDYGTVKFQLKKTYTNEGFGGETFTMTRPLKKIEWGSDVGVKIDGVVISRNPLDQRSYAIDYNTGVLTYSEPPRGGLYAGNTPVTAVDMITTGEGGTSSSLAGPTLGAGIVHYAPDQGWAFVMGVFGSGKGLRKIDVTTGAEVLQRSANSISANAAYRDYSGIICVDGEGFIYLNTGGTSNGQPIIKVDGANLNFVLGWGLLNSDTQSITTSHLTSRPGAASLDNQTFIHVSLFGQVTLHSTATCAALKRVLDLDNGGVGGVCPYREDAFAIGYHDPEDEDFGCALFICSPDYGFKTFSWGAPTARVRACHYDQATGGVIILWEGEEGLAGIGVTDCWAGLWHPDDGGFRWTRRMPAFHQRQGLRDANSQLPLNGVLDWITNAAPFFGSRLWRMETATGLLQSRVTTAVTTWQAYDPARNIIVGAGGSSGTVIVSTDVSQAALAPPEALTIDRAEFHVGVRFDTDHLNMKHDFWTYRSWESIPLVEVRNWDDLELD